MPILERDLAFLFDIYDAGLKIQIATKKVKFYHFERDFMIKSTVERQLEIIGIASKKLSEGTRETLCQIPWKDIIGLRNVIAHEYGEIKIEKIWYVAKFDVPVLLKELKKIKELKPYIKDHKIIAIPL